MRVVSLFSGVGGLDLGFIRAGHQILWANDNYEDAVKTYRRNIGSHILCKDIKDVSLQEIPNHDILIGGFPCQGFSVANTGRTEHDHRNQLYLQLLRVLNAKSPPYFVAENVKGLLSLGKGEVFKMIVNDFKREGYNVTHFVLNAADYGVPQRRERVFIVGVREGVNVTINKPIPTHANPSLGLDRKPWVSIGKALSGIPEPEDDEGQKFYNHTYSKFKLKFNGYLGNREIDPDKPAPTVTGRGDSKGGVVVLHHPNNHRRMSGRELATAQAFPIDFIFEGTQSSIYRQIGNAVPPLLAEAVAKVFPMKVVSTTNEHHESSTETV